MFGDKDFFFRYAHASMLIDGSSESDRIVGWVVGRVDHVAAYAARQVDVISLRCQDGFSQLPNHSCFVAFLSSELLRILSSRIATYVDRLILPRFSSIRVRMLTGRLSPTGTRSSWFIRRRS